MPLINLDNKQAETLVSYLEHFSDRLTKEHAESQSGVGQLLLITAIQDVDRLAVNIKEQLEKATASESDYALIGHA